MRKPTIYRVFAASPRSVATVIQVRDPETGETIDAGELVLYAVKSAIKAPGHNFPARSRLLLTPKTARFLIAAGSVEEVGSTPLPPLREPACGPRFLP